MRWCLLVLVMCGGLSKAVAQNCRGIEYSRQRDCEAICDSKGNCTIRAALLLPRNTTFIASLPAVEPVFELALNDSRVKQWLPPWAKFELMTYDVVDCDPAYAVISAIDAYSYGCAHVYFGPTCDFALAAVGRIAKFLGHTGTPLVTTGGFSFDFVLPKLTCDDEFHMVVRTGGLGFQDIAYFLINVMRHFNWHQLVIFTEPDAQRQVGGKHSCHLTMKSAAESLKKNSIDFISWDMGDEIKKINFTDKLMKYLQYKYTNLLLMRRFGWNRAALLYETQMYAEYAGASFGFLLASTIHDYFVFNRIGILGREILNTHSYKDILLETVGNDYASTGSVNYHSRIKRSRTKSAKIGYLLNN